MKRHNGIALLEVLVSVAILCSGLIVVFQPLLASLSVFNYAAYRLEADRLLANHIWELEDAAKRGAASLPAGDSGVLIGRERAFSYKMTATPLSQDEKLHRLDFDVSWTSGGGTKNMSRSMYLLLPHAPTS